MAITRRQKQVLDFISQFIGERGYSPTYSEIGRGLGMSSSASVHKHIHNLKRKLLISKEYNSMRSIEVRKVCPACGRKTA